jgi:hypothetical protein
LISFYGVGAIATVRNVAFQETELNIASLTSLLARLIL